MECDVFTGVYRVDPIVSPGVLSTHGHVLAGSAGIALNVTFADLYNADGTSCAVTQDRSAYWTPPLIFQHPNGTVEMVPVSGPMLAYYYKHGDNVKAFPAGFRMLAGNNSLRSFDWPVPDLPVDRMFAGPLSTQVARAQRAVGFNCLRAPNDPRGVEGTLIRHTMPSRKLLEHDCDWGLRLELLFPSCWNGKDLDSPDHKSHLAYASDAQGEGNCPPGYDHRLPTLMYEHVFEIGRFRGMPGQFVLSNGDSTGTSYHGDFIMGWDPKFLQTALDHPICGTHHSDGHILSCPIFTIDAHTGVQPSFSDEVTRENCAGPRMGLCGAMSAYIRADSSLHEVTKVVSSSTKNHTAAQATAIVKNETGTYLPASTSTSSFRTYRTTTSATLPVITAGTRADLTTTTFLTTAGHTVCYQVEIITTVWVATTTIVLHGL